MTFNKNIFSQKGIALFTSLWILTILMVIVLSFTYMTRTETLASLAFRQGIEKKFLAEAGVERGIMELFYRKMYRGQTTILEGMEVWKTDGSPYTVKTEDGYYIIRLTDEAGKVDINRTPEVILRNLLANLGLKLEDVDIIADSIMDWKDEDDLHRLNGVESDYYMSLSNPYKAKNADFDTLEELLLVKGITPEILYGNNGKKGIFDFLTVNSKNERINVNAAPKEVLMATGITPEIADAIISSRGNTEGLNLQELGVPPEASKYLTSGDSNTCTIDAVGFKGNEKTGYAVRATVTITSNDKYKYVYYKSPVDTDTEHDRDNND